MIYCFVDLLIYWFICSFIYWSVDLLMHRLIHLFNCSFIVFFFLIFKKKFNLKKTISWILKFSDILNVYFSHFFIDWFNHWFIYWSLFFRYFISFGSEFYKYDNIFVWDVNTPSWKGHAYFISVLHLPSKWLVDFLSHKSNYNMFSGFLHVRSVQKIYSELKIYANWFIYTGAPSDEGKGCWPSSFFWHFFMDIAHIFMVWTL